MTTFRIGELASQGSVNLETIRYYEREGLMRPPQRTRPGHRTYAPGDILRLRFIKRSQALGFTLTEEQPEDVPNSPAFLGGCAATLGGATVNDRHQAD